MKIGFIGLGTMGIPMAKNLAKSGHHLIVYNRTASRADEFRQKDHFGIAETIAEVVEKSELIWTMLSDDAAMEEVYFAENGIMSAILNRRENMGQPEIVLDSSTISPQISSKIAEKLAACGIEFMDAPVSGSEPQAIEGSLGFMVGGNQETFDRCYPLFMTLGNRAVLMGNHGAGSFTKLANNSISAINMLAVVEGLRMVTKSGIDPELFLKVVSSGGARSGMIDIKGPKILQEDYHANFKAKLMYKDIGLALQLSESLQLPAPVLTTVHEQFLAACEQGYGNEDMCAVMKVVNK